MSPVQRTSEYPAAARAADSRSSATFADGILARYCTRLTSTGACSRWQAAVVSSAGSHRSMRIRQPNPIPPSERIHFTIR